MAVTTHVNSETGARTHTVVGPLTPDDLLDALRHVYADPDYRPEACVLWDFTNAEIRRFSHKEIRRVADFVAEHRNAPAGTCAALVVSKTLDFGLARIYQQMLEAATPVEVMVFRDLDEANAWLKRVPST